MPYFKWQGTDITGSLHTGRLYAQSEQELDAILFKRQIALLKHKQLRMRLQSGHLSLATKSALFGRMGTLFSAGIAVPKALQLIGQSNKNPHAACVMYDCAQKVTQGIALSSALASHARLFDAMCINMISVGQESGSLAQSCVLLSNYFETKQQLAKKMRNAALMPAMTFIFFGAIALILLFGVAPQFEQIYQSLNQALPASTRRLLWLSRLLYSWYGLVVGTGIVVFVYLMSKIIQKYSKNYLGHVLAVHMPYVGGLITFNAKVLYLRALAVLLENGCPLMCALATASEVVNNSYIRAQLHYIEHEVRQGSLLSSAFAHNQRLWDDEIIVLVTIGQEAGNLPIMLHQAAQLQQELLQQRLLIITSLVQPLLLIVLGLLIGSFIMALYAPIFSMSPAV